MLLAVMRWSALVKRMQVVQQEASEESLIHRD
jgi:hypothetical protein